MPSKVSQTNTNMKSNTTVENSPKGKSNKNDQSPGTKNKKRKEMNVNGKRTVKDGVLGKSDKNKKKNIRKDQQTLINEKNDLAGAKLPSKKHSELLKLGKKGNSDAMPTIASNSSYVAVASMIPEKYLTKTKDSVSIENPSSTCKQSLSDDTIRKISLKSPHEEYFHFDDRYLTKTKRIGLEYDSDEQSSPTSTLYDYTVNSRSYKSTEEEKYGKGSSKVSNYAQERTKVPFGAGELGGGVLPRGNDGSGVARLGGDGNRSGGNSGVGGDDVCDDAFSGGVDGYDDRSDCNFGGQNEQDFSGRADEGDSARFGGECTRPGGSSPGSSGGVNPGGQNEEDDSDEDDQSVNFGDGSRQSNRLIGSYCDQSVDPRRLLICHDTGKSMLDRVPRDRPLKFVTLQELLNWDEDEPLSNKIFLVRILYIKVQAEGKRNSNYAVKLNVRGSAKPSNFNMTYDRLVFLSCVFGDTHDNVGLLVQASNLNTEFFKNGDVANVKRAERYGPGGYIAIINPTVIDSYLGKGGVDIPIIKLRSKPFPVSINTRCLPEMPFIRDSLKLHHFLYHNCEVTVHNLNIRPTNCCGTLCDSLELFNNGHSYNSCGCIHPTSRALKSIILADLVVTPKGDNEKFRVRNFLSKRFTSLFFKGESFFGGLDSLIPEHTIIYDVEFAMNKILQKVNESGGWTICGWLRMGQVNDNNKEASPQVSQDKYLAGNCYHHISTITYSQVEKALIDQLESDLDQFRIDLSSPQYRVR